MAADPEVFARCVREQVSKGKTSAAASAFCQARLEKSAIIKPGTKELTERGRRREALAGAASQRESPAVRERKRAEVERKRQAGESAANKAAFEKRQDEAARKAKEEAAKRNK